MSMLNIGKKLDRMQKSKLQEAKADTQRLIDFAGQDLADRFDAIKKQLKAPENDLYYWIKNKTIDELEQVILKTETAISKTQTKKEITEHGAKLICDTEHWKVYHITTFEASQKYGRDSKWCITGVNNYGDNYWKDYTARGVKFYFAITKQNYDPRGNESKFAFAVFPDQSIELFNQVDDRVKLKDIPYGEELTIPGIDLDNILDPDEDAPGSYWCDDCGRGLNEDEYYLTPDGEYRCMDCFYAICQFCEVCGEATYTDDTIQSVYGNFYCEHCWSNEYIGSEDSWADTFIAMAEAYSDGEIAEMADDGDLERMLKVWAAAKSNEAILRLDLSEDRIAELEQSFIKFAAKDGITITPDMLELSASLKPITENGQWMVFKPANIEDSKQIARNNGWTDEDIDYAELQCWNEEELYTTCKVYLIMSKSGRPSGYSGNDVGIYFLEIRPDGYFNLQEDTGFWCDRYPAIKGAEDLDIEGFKFPTPDKDGMFYTQEGKHKVLRGCTYQIATGLKTYTVKEGTTKIGQEALYDAGNLETLVIPESVKVIDELGIPDDDNFTDYKVVCKKGSYAETYCKEHNIPTKLTETFNTSNEFIEASSLAEEVDEYENMWSQPLVEIKRYVAPSNNSSNNLGSQSTTPPTQPAPANQPTPSAPGSTTKAKKRKQVKNKFGILVDDWEPEFTKLMRHIYQVNKQPADLKDSRLGANILRLYFIVPSGEEWRLEITSTTVSIGNNGIQMQEYWDYALSTLRNNDEIIISRGHVADYNALLDTLLKEKVIKDKTKCI